jgi:uncharacterized protein YutE (UPF0331/DUF86 family)
MFKTKQKKGIFPMSAAHKKLNLSRIRDKVADVRENLQVLREYSSLDSATFRSNQEVIRSARYAFIVMIEASSNIASHLCARVLSKSPDSYAECFLILGENDLIDKDLSMRLGKMAGFRNLLVHGYAEVDDDKMFAIMKNDLADIDSWLEFVRAILVKQSFEGGHDG